MRWRRWRWWWWRQWRWRPLRIASDVLSSLSSLHRGSLRYGRRMFPSGSDEAPYGGLGTRSRRWLKFLNCNVRKLFGMVGNMRGKWCNSCRKYH
jgi:hypothetical protein